MILNDQIIKLKVDFETSRMFVLMQSFRNVPDHRSGLAKYYPCRTGWPAIISPNTGILLYCDYSHLNWQDETTNLIGLEFKILQSKCGEG
jgi:hypothetical protein